jgi:hypothetical protein
MFRNRSDMDGCRFFAPLHAVVPVAMNRFGYG